MPLRAEQRLRGAPNPRRRRRAEKALHVTLSHKPPQHRGLPRPEGAPSRQTPDAVFAAASPRGRRTDDASRNNRAPLLVPRRPYPKRAPAPLPARARPAPARPSLNLAPKASSIAHRTASSALSKISRAFLRSSKKAARLQTLASLEDVVANRFAAASLPRSSLIFTARATLSAWLGPLHCFACVASFDSKHNNKNQQQH